MSTAALAGVIGAAAGTLLIAAMEFLAGGPPHADILTLLSSVGAMEQEIASWGAWAPLASALLMVIHSFVPFPAEMLAVANGMLFGLWMGIAVTWAGAMAGALLAFALARWLGRSFVLRLIGEERSRRLEAWTGGHGAKALLLARLTPVISFNLVNYGAGLTGVGWWMFAWTTAVGILPITVASVLVGSHMAVIPWGIWAVVVAAIGALMLVHWRHRSRVARADQPQAQGRESQASETDAVTERLV